MLKGIVPILATSFHEDESVDFVDKGGIFSQVDLGIVRCHFEIGAEKSFPI